MLWTMQMTWMGLEKLPSAGMAVLPEGASGALVGWDVDAAIPEGRCGGGGGPDRVWAPWGGVEGGGGGSSCVGCANARPAVSGVMLLLLVAVGD